MNIKKIAGIFFVLCIIAVGVVFLGKQRIDDYFTKPRIEKTQLFTVQEGIHFSRLGDDLLAKSIIKNQTGWKAISKLHPELTNIKSGTYQLEVGMSLEDILQLINSGKEHQFKITLIEGNTFKQWVESINNTNNLNKLQKTENEIIAALNIPHKKIEGLLFPETYHYIAGMDAYKIIEKAYKNQSKMLEKLWPKRDKGLPYKTPYEALIMASIIEKESGLSDDRDKISSVFVNRLRMGMRLQTDPTVIYGMGDRYKGKIRRKDLREKTAYNTYRINGLPPTPIAMPSEAALYATLHPSKTKYLYFVSKGDGTSYFSKNLKEHNRAVRKYILGK